MFRYVVFVWFGDLVLLVDCIDGVGGCILCVVLFGRLGLCCLI